MTLIPPSVSFWRKSTDSKSIYHSNIIWIHTFATRTPIIMAQVICDFPQVFLGNAMIASHTRQQLLHPTSFQIIPHLSQSCQMPHSIHDIQKTDIRKTTGANSISPRELHKFSVQYCQLSENVYLITAHQCGQDWKVSTNSDMCNTNIT